jgi:ASCH domain
MAKFHISGLTIHQPWTNLIVSGVKKIENRSWKPSEDMIGSYIAIHSGKSFDYIGALMVEREFGIRITEATSSMGAIVAVGRLERIVTHSPDPWFYGPYGWVLTEVTPITPIPCRGSQRLWALPEDVRERVFDAYMAVLSGKQNLKSRLVA